MEDDHNSDVELEEFKRNGALDIEEPQSAESAAFLEAESSTTPVLSWQEKRNLIFLFCLYMIHALPMAFSWYSMPLLLRQQLNYTLIGTYYISQYPYSIKLAWAPIIQSKYMPLLGRRKTWIVPCFFTGGLVLFWLGFHQDDLITRTAAGEQGTLLWLVAAWLILTFICASLRIALDDWSLDLLSQPNVHLAATTSTFGEMSAAFFSFNLFLGISSLGHPNAGTKGEEVSTRPYFLITGTAFTLLSLLVLLTTSSSPTTTTTPLRSSYAIILQILKLPQIWTLILVHMTSMIGFETNDAITLLQLVKTGFSDRDIAFLATVSLPLELLTGTLLSKYLSTHHPLTVWRTLFPYRLAICIISQFGVLLITSLPQRSHTLRWLIALGPYMASKQLEDSMFIAILSFHVQVADPEYGGIYLPLLATTLNVRYDVLGFVYTKTIGWIDGGEGLEGGGSAAVDGYQIVNLVGVVLAVPVYWFFLRPATTYLAGLDKGEWRVGRGRDEEGKGRYVGLEMGDVGEEDGGEMVRERRDS